MRASGRQRERSSRTHPEQPPLRIERVEERVEVALVRAAAVKEDERAVWLSGSRALVCAEEMAHEVAL